MYKVQPIKIPSEDLINYLVNMLEDARSGELESLVSICRYKGNRYDYGWSGCDRSDIVFGLLGTMEAAKPDILETLVYVEPPTDET